MRYKVHIQGKGWSEWVEEGRQAGTTGEGLRLEAIIIEGDGVKRYRGYVENIGWMEWVNAGEVVGTEGRGLRLEAIVIEGSGDLNYCTHVQNIGWLNWVRSGEKSGTEGYGYRIEAIKVLRNRTALGVDSKDGYIKAPPKPNPVPKPIPNQPSQALKGKVIVVDAGHGGSDAGAVGNITEKEQNLQVALNLGQRLKEEGATVILTRGDDRWMSLQQRVAIANNNRADMLISIHHNGSNDPSSHGSETICHPSSSGGYQLAQLVLNGITNRLGTRARRIIRRDDYMVTYTNMVAIITEASFTSNPNEVHKFKNGGAELEVLGIMDGILAYFA